MSRVESRKYNTYNEIQANIPLSFDRRPIKAYSSYKNKIIITNNRVENIFYNYKSRYCVDTYTFTKLIVDEFKVKIKLIFACQLTHYFYQKKK